MNDAAIRLGILKCRDLVELYYGVRMVASVLGQTYGSVPTWTEIIQQDARRIKYEIVMTNDDAAAAHIATLGAINGLTGQLAIDYYIPARSSVIVTRSFLTDLDTVCQAVYAAEPTSFVEFCTRETFLTPLPADES